MAEFEQMQEAGKLAREEVVHLLESMTPEERMGAVKLVNWQPGRAVCPLAREEVVHLLESMTPEERMGAVKLVNWIRKWYISAGYKQLLSPKYDGLLVTLKE